MVLMRGIFLWIVVSAPGQVAAGEIKRWVDEEGAIHFGDTPPASAQAAPTEVELRPVDRQNRQRLARTSRTWMKARFKGRPPNQVQPESTTRGYAERLRYKNAQRGDQLLIGMTQDEVRSMFGKPNSVSARSGHSGSRDTWLYRWKDRPSKRVHFEQGKVSGWN